MGQYRTVRGHQQRVAWRVLGAVAFAYTLPTSAEVNAQSLVEGALDLTRGASSYAELSMTIHRPSWERTLSLVAWTRGREDALIRFTAPPKDAGTATLKKGERMWTYAPKIGREIRLPSSMMSQQWAGSDFSYNDLSRTDKYLRDYDFEIVHTEHRDGHTVYTLDMVPHDDAPVVWGKETLVLRDDYVTLSQTFYDQELEPVKRMETLTVGELGGRTFALAMRMQTVDKANSWTEIRYVAADFDAEVDDSHFTTFALRGR
ncbi:MAG: outer membrane lipoprotein-sorting protein [Gammaproteobacteria bacterium]|nr:outer membrane lipoprotein-sorting protein [Gammaproteobacteria bacterium]